MSLLGIFTQDLIAVILILNAIIVLTMLFWERVEPRSALLWVVVLVMLPIVGFFLYLIFGQTFYVKRTFKKQAMLDKNYDELNKKELIVAEKELREHPENLRKLKFAKALRTAGGKFYTESNDVVLLAESEKYFDMLLKDLSNAEKHIHFEYYIIRNDEISNKLMDILIDKAKNGVEVRMMVDGIGNNGGPKTKIKELRNAGGEFCLFHNILTYIFSPKKNNRNHRKIAVIDGKIGYIGGYNIGDEYLGKGPYGYWRDCAVRIEGEAVRTLQFRFTVDWNYATKKEIITDEKYYPDHSNNGNENVQIVSGGPDVSDSNPIHTQYLGMVTTSRETIYIQTPYLAPDQSLLDSLKMMALLGVDVRIIIPNKKDHIFVFWANRYFANKLMQSGVKVYEYQRGFIHSKTVVSDRFFCSVGSANYDDRSMKLNFESNAMIYSSKIGEEMTNSFLKDLEDCTEYTKKMYKNRTVFQKMKTSISRLASGQL